MRSFYIFIFILSGFTGLAHAQENQTSAGAEGESSNFFTTNIDYSVGAHFSIGGAAPLGLPRSIRHIRGYDPKLQLGLEAKATKWIDKNWGIRAGISFEGKGMTTKAEVKDYRTEIIQDDESLRGYFTGRVKTVVKNSYLTIPISAVYKLTDRWNLYGGFHFSYLVDKQFDGRVKNGHFREDTPVGTKLTFNEDSDGAPYDFSDNLQKFQWGLQIGTEWYLKNQHFYLFPELTFGINGIFPSDFDALSFSMHNIYLNMGFGYQF